MSDESIDINAKVGELLKLPCKIQYLVNGQGTDTPTVTEKRHYPQYSRDLGQAELIINEMHNRGFYIKLYGHFRPGEPCFAMFELHDVTESRPLWQASSDNRAEAIVRAALLCIEGNPETFKAKEATHVQMV